MNWAKFTPVELSAILTEARMELISRETIATAGDPFAAIPGQEATKRAIAVAAVTKSPLAILYSPNSYHRELLQACAAVEVPAVAYTPCPCGNLSDPISACSCRPHQIEKHRRARPVAVLYTSAARIPVRELAGFDRGYRGTNLATILGAVQTARERLSPSRARVVSSDGHLIIKQAVTELGIDPRAVTFIANSIAALEGALDIGAVHVAEACYYCPRG